MNILSLLVAILLLASACATPVGVTHVDTQVMYRSLTSSVSCSVRPVISAVGAERISRPPSMTTTWSQIRSSSPIRWEVTTTEMPNAKNRVVENAYRTGAYSAAVEIDGWVYVSGQGPVDPRKIGRAHV